MRCLVLFWKYGADAYCYARSGLAMSCSVKSGIEGNVRLRVVMLRNVKSGIGSEKCSELGRS